MKICLSAAMEDRWGTEIVSVAPDAEPVTIGPDGAYDGDPTGTDVLLFSGDLADSDAALTEVFRVMGMESLAWVQAPGAGVESPLWADLVERGVRLTNAAGVHAEPIAQYVFAYVLHWHRQVARHQAQQVAHEWSAIVSDDLTAKTLGIVGHGGIGRATARVAKAFGMRVLALRRSRIDDPNVDEAFGTDGLFALLEQSDYVVVATPLTSATRRLIGADALARMGADAVLINVARGGVVDQDALIDVLRDGAIRGATLDVVEPEPLPADSPLWDLSNCVITPHDAGYSPLAGERLGRLFVENLACYRRGERMHNEVDAADLS